MSRRLRPGLTALVPEGWFVRESLEFVSAPRHAYAIASVVTVKPAETAEQLADRHGRVLADRLPGYEELAVETVRLADSRPAIMRRFRWTPAEQDARAELHLYAVQGRRAILARGGCAAERFAELEPELRELLSGIGVGTPPSPVGVRKIASTPRERTYSAFEGGRLTTTRAAAFGLETAEVER